MPAKPASSLPVSPLYAPYLSSDEKKALRKVSVGDTSSEINLLRILLSLFMKFQQAAPQDLYARIVALHTCVVLNEQLVRLVRCQLLQPPCDDRMQEFWDVLDEVTRQDGLDKLF